MSRLKPITRLCADCRQRIPIDASVCPICKAAQRKWGEFISFSSTNLALLIALISVTTSLLSILLPIWKPAGSSIQLIFESMTETEASFLARNEGRSGGVIRLDSMYITNHAADNEADTFSVSLAHNGTYIESGREQRISVQVVADSTKGLCEQIGPYAAGARKYLADSMGNVRGAQYQHGFLSELREIVKVGMSCNFKVRETSFNSEDRYNPRFKVDCDNISVISDCLNAIE